MIEPIVTDAAATIKAHFENQFHDAHAGTGHMCKTPTFRVWREGGLRHAMCEECEKHGARDRGHFSDRIEWGWDVLRINMMEHASTYHTRR